MSTIKADTGQPSDFASDLTLGASGDTVTVAGDSILTDKVQDKGGNTLWDYSTGVFVSSNKAFASQNLKLLATQVVTGDTVNVSFTQGIDSTYDVYIFKFIKMRVTSGYDFGFQGSTDGGSNFLTTLTSGAFRAFNTESASTGNLIYSTGRDRENVAVLQSITGATVTSSDGCSCGELRLFAPSSTTYVKQYYSTSNCMHPDPASINFFTGGYFNTTSAINAITFGACNDSGSTSGMPYILTGTIKMYGLL